MKQCPYCKESVREDAVKCRFCHSSLLPPPEAQTKDADDRITYVVDSDLVRFAKFSAAVLALFLVVGGYLFGWDLKASVSRVDQLRKDVEIATTDLKKSQAELLEAKTKVGGLKTEVETLLVEAKAVLAEIARNRDESVTIVGTMRLSQGEERVVAQLKQEGAPKVRPGSSKYWATGSTIRVRMLGGDPKQQTGVREAAAEWERHANIKFDFVTVGASDVRVAFAPSGGSWSYVGTDALAVPQDKPTMNYGWSERRTFLHEFGHVLGLVEEHTNPKAKIHWDKELILKDMSGAPNFWSKAQIEEKFFKRADGLGDYREFDAESIMTFELDRRYTGGLKLGGNGELSPGDKAFIAKIYPKP